MSTEIQSSLAFRRVLLKISGEALVGEQTFGIDVNVAKSVAEEIKQLHSLGLEVALVVGGGVTRDLVAAANGSRLHDVTHRMSPVHGKFLCPIPN